MMASIRETITKVFLEVAEKQGKTFPSLTDDVILTETGLDSFAMATIVVCLEDELGINPFATEDADDMMLPYTFGDVITIYEGAMVQ